MTLEEAVRRAGLSEARARHYQAIGLLPEREPDGYDESDVHTLCFIRRARALGFHVGEIRALLSLWQDPSRPVEEAHRLAERHAAQIRQRIAVLQAMLIALQRLTEGCRAGDRPHCAILEDAGCGGKIDFVAEWEMSESS